MGIEVGHNSEPPFDPDRPQDNFRNWTGPGREPIYDPRPSIEDICEGGRGGGSIVYLQLRNTFPGLGGEVRTTQAFISAYRVNHAYSGNLRDGCDIQNDGARTALKEFLVHVTIKILDDYFFRAGKYRYSHIARPLGFSNAGYFYEWVDGRDGYCKYEDGQYIRLDEWVTCTGAFGEAGIDLSWDIDDVEQHNWTKNVVIEPLPLLLPNNDYPKAWKRIDLGLESIRYNLEQLQHYLWTNETKLRELLNQGSVDLLLCAVRYLSTPGASPETFEDFSELEKLTRSYRLATAEHMGLEGLSTPKEIRRTPILPLSADEIRSVSQISCGRRMREKQDQTSLLDIELRRTFPCVDGTIVTQQELAVAKITRHLDPDPNSGFKLFLRHFIIKKIENALIAMGKYNYPHIARPLGAEGRSYIYEWAFGAERCPFEFIKAQHPSNRSEGLDDWFEFVAFFAEAGIDMQSGVRPIEKAGQPGLHFAKQIIVRQPEGTSDQKYLTRMWKRVNFHENVTPIDYDRLRRFILVRADELIANSTPGRFEAMLLAVKYLDGRGITLKDCRALKERIHDYRLSALTHLDHFGFGAAHYGLPDLGVMEA
ncbi:MAG: hypothetical protein DCC75_02995 [Proteobacteria bacterium]|nr:MAG: hypothetical protein DCC75_02995 [Pseudomonadota bacterium]